MEKLIIALMDAVKKENVWWGNPVNNAAIALGVQAGFLARRSITQIDWTEAGLAACYPEKFKVIDGVFTRLKW